MDQYSSSYIIKNVNEVQKRIADHVLRTPLLHSKWLSSITGCNVFLKMESEQITGSFKLRGAANKVLKINSIYEETGEKKAIVTASSGNHGLATAHMTSKLNIPLIVYVYKTVPKIKEESLRQFENIQLVKEGEECGQTELFARENAKQFNIEYVSPYNDIDVLFGQGTIGLEMLDQDLDAVIVPVGGGGLIGGIAAYIKSVNPSIRVIGCQPEVNCCMYESIKAGRIVDNNLLEDTFADGVAGYLDMDSITYDFCNKFVDDWVLLSEEEIEKAVFDILNKEKKMVEGAAGLAIATVQKMQDQLKDKNVGLIICGAALGVSKLKYLLDKFN